MNYTIKNDIIFKFLFSDKEFLKDFLEACLNEDIEDLEITNEFSLDKVNYNDKLGVLDIKAKINKEKIADIEMQRNAQDFYVQRVLLYTGNLSSTQLDIGEKYQNLSDVISINILDFVLFEDIDKIHTVWTLRENSNLEHEPLKGLEMHFLELPKFRKSVPNLKNKIDQWLALIDTENEGWVDVAMESNKKVKDAKNKVDDFMSEKENRILVELRRKYELDYNSSIYSATQKGLKQGIEQGIEQGKKQGILKEKIEIAKKLLKQNIDISNIKEITGLEEKEILKLR